MVQKITFIRKCCLAVVAGLALFGMSGCDQLRQQIASMVQPKSAQATLASAQQAFAEGQYTQALEQIEPLAKQPADMQPAFALLGAQIHARTGKTQEALTLLAKALEGGAVEATSLIVHPDFESLRTDVRFLALLTHQGARAPAPASPQAPAPAPVPAPVTAPAQPPSPNAVSVDIGPGGVSAKAGSVSVKLPP
jgi:hypothetical protein